MESMKKRKFINLNEEFEDDIENEDKYWTLQEVQKYYEDLKKNKEYNACHSNFEEWLKEQEQFKEIKKYENQKIKKER